MHFGARTLGVMASDLASGHHQVLVIVVAQDPNVIKLGFQLALILQTVQRQQPIVLQVRLIQVNK